MTRKSKKNPKKTKKLSPINRVIITLLLLFLSNQSTNHRWLPLPMETCKPNQWLIKINNSSNNTTSPSIQLYSNNRIWKWDRFHNRWGTATHHLLKDTTLRQHQIKIYTHNKFTIHLLISNWQCLLLVSKCQWFLPICPYISLFNYLFLNKYFKSRIPDNSRDYFLTTHLPRVVLPFSIEMALSSL